MALHEHCAPYAECLPRISVPEDIWPHASVEFVAILQRDRKLIVEIGYKVAWDEEHTLGARLWDGKLIELNGSVLPP